MQAAEISQIECDVGGPIFAYRPAGLGTMCPSLPVERAIAH